MALDRHQQLVLDVCQANLAGTILAPALETSQCDTEGEQVLEVRPGGLCQGTLPLSRFPESP